MTTQSGELNQAERLELESLRELWRAMKPFLSQFSVSVIFAKVDAETSQKAMKAALDSYGPMAQAAINYSQQYGKQHAEQLEVAA